MKLAAVLCAATIMAADPVYSEPSTPILPSEPPIINNDPLGNPLALDADYDWRTNLFYIFYDLYQNGTVNYMTARRVIRVSQNEYTNTVVELVAEYPLFYWFDINGDGRFRHEDNEIWVDPEEDGINGNEVQYHLQDQGIIPNMPR